MSNKTAKHYETLMKARKYFTDNSASVSAKQNKAVPTKSELEKAEQAKLVPIKNVNDKPVKRTRLSNIEHIGKPTVIKIENGSATVSDGKGNRYNFRLNNKMKSQKWDVTQVNDGWATIKYADGGYDDIYIR